MTSLLFRGWVRALVSAIAVAVCVVALGEAVSLVLYAGKVLPHETIGQAMRQGLIFSFLFHHVPLHLDAATLQLPERVNRLIGLPTGFQVNAFLDFGLMTGTVLVLWLLARAGRTIASGTGGSPLERAAQGAKVAIPYTLLTSIGAHYVELHERFPHTSVLNIHPSYYGAIFWPLFIALVCGIVGGVRSSDRDQAHDWLQWKMTTRWRLRWTGALTGAKTMLVLGLGLSFAGLLVVAIFTPSQTSAFFRALTANGIGSGVASALMIAMAIPNIAAWVLMPAMGGCLEVGGAGTANAAPAPYCFLSYSNSPAHPLPATNNDWAFFGLHELGAGSHWLLLFLLVPMLAAFIGGMRAVRTARASTPREALIVTVLTAAVFGAFIGITFVLAWLRIKTNGAIASAENYVRYGPYPPDAVQLAIGWAIVVGGIGAFWMQRRLKHAG